MSDLGPQRESSAIEREKLAFEREKWEAEQRQQKGDSELREKEYALKVQETRRGATIAAVGSAYVSWENNQGSLKLETFKAESARIFEVIKTGNPDAAAKNLGFLLDTGLIQSTETANHVRDYLNKLKPGEGVSLPPESIAQLVTSISVMPTPEAVGTIGRLCASIGHAADPVSLAILKKPCP